MKKQNKHVIAIVQDGSIAQELELVPGDILLTVNGQPVEDIFDYRYLMNEEFVVLEVEKANGEIWELEVEKEELAMALDASGEVESLHKPIYQKDGNEIQLLDKLEEEEGQEETILNHMLIRQLLEELDREERQLIYLRYFANQTQSEIGKKLGISQVQVSRLEKKILKNMRTKIQTG